MEEIEPHADVDDAEEPKEVSKVGKFNSAVAEAPAAEIAAANEKKTSPPPSAAAAAAVLAEKDLNTCGDIDELPDWMAVSVPQVRRSSPIVKSYFDDVMPGNLNRQSSPMYVHDTSSDEEDDFDMQAAYTAAAADVAATNAPAEPAAVKGNKKVGRGKTARTTGNQATLAAVKKPKAVPTKKQATAKAKTPKTKAATTAAKGKKQQPARNLSATRKAELSPMDWKEQDEFEDPYAGDDQGGDMHMFDGNWDDAPIDDVAWIPAAQRPLESSSPDEDPFDLDEDPIEDPSDPKERKNTRVTVPVVKSAQNKNTWQGNAASGDIKKMGKGEATAAAGGAGAKHAAVAGLKAALAKGSNTEKNNTLTNGDDEIDMSPPEAATGVKPRRTLDAAAVLKKRTSPPSTVKGKGKSRLAALKGAAGGVGIDGKTVAGGAAAAYTPARLQTITPAVEGGKKRGIGSDEPITKTKSKSTVAVVDDGLLVANGKINEAEPVKFTRKQRAVPAVPTGKVGLALEATSSDDDGDQGQIVHGGTGTGIGTADVDKGRKFLDAVGPTPEDGYDDDLEEEEEQILVVSKGKGNAKGAHQAKQAKISHPTKPAAVKGKGRAKAAAAAAKAELELKPPTATTAAKKMNAKSKQQEATKPSAATRRQSAVNTKPNAWDFNTAEAEDDEEQEVQRPETTAAFDPLFDTPDEAFEIDLGSDLDESDQGSDEDLPTRGRGGGNGRTGGGGNTNRGGGGRGGGRDSTTASILALLQNGLGGGTTGRSPESDYEEESDDEDQDDDDGMGSGLVQIQAAIAQTMAARQRKAQQTRNAQVKKLEKETKGALFAAQVEVQKEVTAAEATAAETLAQMAAKVKENEEEIRVVQEEYEAKMVELGEKQRALAAEAQHAQQVAAKVVADARSSGKRKLHEAFAAVKSKLEDGKKRIQRAAKRARRMPDFASLLLPLFAGG